MLSKVLIMKTTQTPPRMDDNRGLKYTYGLISKCTPEDTVNVITPC